MSKENTVPCPIHNKPLVVVVEPGRECAVCTCDPNDSQWYGKTVYTKLTATVEPKKETENKS